ncbi:MAG: rhodanese-like domain-containing protein, partial [Deltaproteobacteria bacterium]
MKGFRRMKGLWVMAMVAALVFSVSLTVALAADKTPTDLVNEAKEKVCEISVADAKAKIDSGAPLFILDVREPDEFSKGHIPKAINIPRGLLEFKIASAIPDKEAHIIAYCKTGGRSCLACNTLQELGY